LVYCFLFSKSVNFSFSAILLPRITDWLIVGCARFSRLAISTVVISSSRTPQKQSNPRAFTVCLYFPGERTSFGSIPKTFDTRLTSQSKSYPRDLISCCCSYFSCASDNTFSTKSPSPRIRSSPFIRVELFRNAVTADHPPALRIKPPPTRSGLLPWAIPFSTNLR